MRTFVAIDLPEDLRSRIQALMNSLRPAASGVRWPRPEGLHITLKFIGEISPVQVGEVQRCLSALPPAAPIAISIRGSGFFPSLKRPRVLWLGVEAGPELPQLAGQIDAELAQMGLAAETRAYNPHLTLARTDGSAKLDRLVAQLEQMGKVDLGTFTADQYFLYESKLAPGGSIYRKLFRVPLPASAQ